ncbi:MAG: hypothetical protein KC731_08545 [Myxococcales bacterium]|nr:hypothetical protein [Myxococcales bacterium]
MMAGTNLERAVEDLPSLRGVFVTAMPDCLLYDSWTRPGEEWASDEAGAYFGDLVRANREALKSLGSWSAEMQVTIESADLLLVLRELRNDFVVTFAFDRTAALGMVRLQVKRTLSVLMDLLPRVEPEERPRGNRIYDYLLRYAPDPHAVIQRVALRTRIPLEQLEAPETLQEDQIASFEVCVKEILGVDNLHL